MPVTPEDLSIPRASLGVSANIEEAVNPALERIAAIMTPQDQGPMSTLPAATESRRGMVYHVTSPIDLILRCDGTNWHPIVEFPIGGVLDWPAASNPNPYPEIRATWLEMNGQGVLSSNYPLLAAAWGITGTSITIPDRRGRVGVGAGTGPGGLTPRVLGAVGGAEEHLLTPTQTARVAHEHDMQAQFHGGNPPGLTSSGGKIWVRGSEFSGAGGTDRSLAQTALGSFSFGIGVGPVVGGAANASAPHPNMQPFRVTRYFVRAA